MIGAIVYQLTKNLTEKEIKDAGFEDYFVDHTLGIYPQSSAGVPFSAGALAVKGDPITDLHEDMAADGGTFKIHTNNMKIPHTHVFGVCGIPFGFMLRFYICLMVNINITFVLGFD